jgi:hypothetical protein
LLSARLTGVIGLRDIKIAGQAQAQVVFDPDQVTDQALHVQAAQHRTMPDLRAQCAQRPVERASVPSTAVTLAHPLTTDND